MSPHKFFDTSSYTSLFLRLFCVSPENGIHLCLTHSSVHKSISIPRKVDLRRHHPSHSHTRASPSVHLFLLYFHISFPLLMSPLTHLTATVSLVHTIISIKQNVVLTTISRRDNHFFNICHKNRVFF